MLTSSLSSAFQRPLPPKSFTCSERSPLPSSSSIASYDIPPPIVTPPSPLGSTLSSLPSRTLPSPLPFGKRELDFDDASSLSSIMSSGAVIFEEIGSWMLRIFRRFRRYGIHLLERTSSLGGRSSLDADFGGLVRSCLLLSPLAGSGS